MFYLSKLNCNFPERMTWSKWRGEISIIWISIYTLCAEQLHLFLCDFGDEVCLLQLPTLLHVHTKGNITAQKTRPLHFAIYSLFIMEIVSRTQLLRTSGIRSCWVAKCLGRGQFVPHYPIMPDACGCTIWSPHLHIMTSFLPCTTLQKMLDKWWPCSGQTDNRLKLQQ